MVNNNWKKRLQKAGMSQNALADVLGMNRGHFSRVCQGAAVIDLDLLRDAAAAMSCSIYDIYDEAALRVLYQIGIEEAPKPKRCKTVCVRIRADVSDGLDMLVEGGTYQSRNEAANALLRAAL